MCQSALILENEAVIALSIQKILEHKGFNKTTIKSDGTEGLAKAQEMKPDLIIADLNLPGKNALEIITELKNKIIGKLPPILIISGEKMPKSTLQSLDLKAIDFVSKPFTRTDINSFLKTYVSRLCDERT